MYYDGREYSMKKGDGVFIDCKNTYTHMTGEDEDRLWRL